MLSIILRQASRYLQPLILLMSLLLLVAGHNEPGGGFVAGLVAAAAFFFVAFAEDVDAARRLVRVDPYVLIVGGLSVAWSSALIATLKGEPLMTGLWTTFSWMDFTLTIGTPLLFDFGVYLVVLGVGLMLFLDLSEVG